jgi:hypothetical protein
MPSYLKIKLDNIEDFTLTVHEKYGTAALVINIM